MHDSNMHGERIKILFNMFLLTYFIIVFHIFYISYSSVNEISYFKDTVNCICKNTF